VINLKEPGEGLPWVQAISGDACDAREPVGGDEFDLVFSNSLIEHLGGHMQRRRFADVVRAMAPRYSVQTPYRYFPVEPHWVLPGMQFLPLSVRSWIPPPMASGTYSRPDPGRCPGRGHVRRAAEPQRHAHLFP
jgi:hypothetical protein